jgi:hypothetical protein
MTLFATCLLAAGLCVAAPAHADVGIETTSRAAGTPGDAVTVTVGCGACMAIGAPRSPGSFPVSLVPLAKAPKPHPCGPRTLCSPETLRPPSRSPYSFLGQATPLQGSRSSDGKVSRYRLRFEVPDLRPGVYTYVVFCDMCADGEAGSLIANRYDPEARLRVRPPNPVASA